MAYGIPRNLESQYNVLTVPNYVKDLVVTASPGTIHAAYTAPPGVEAWTVFRPSAEGVPVHPFDGWRVVTPLAEDAETTVAVNLTEGVVNGTEYVVRVFIRGELGFQTRVGGAVARVTPVAGIPYSAIPEGGLISLDEAGSPVLFYAAKHGYEPDLNGPGRSLTVRKDCHSNRQWHTSNVNAYATCALDAWFNGEYKTLLDPKVQTAIGSTKFYYTPGNGNTVVTTLERSIFLLSFTELGESHSYANVEGSGLPIASSLKTAYLDGVPRGHWTRTPNKTNRTSTALLTSDAYRLGFFDCSSSYGARPAFTLPSDMLFHTTPNPDGSYSPIL